MNSVLLMNRTTRHFNELRFEKGQEEGLINSSIIADIVKFQALDGLRNEGNKDLSALEQIDQTSIHKVIYMAFKGANLKKTQLLMNF